MGPVLTMLRVSLVGIALASAAMLVHADPAGCGTWHVTSTFGEGDEAFGDQAGFCAAAAADAATVGGTQLSCSAPTPYAATEVVQLGGTSYTFTFVRNGCTPPPDEPASSASGAAREPMDWTKTAHLLQAMFFGLCSVMFVHGFSAGNRL